MLLFKSCLSMCAKCPDVQLRIAPGTLYSKGAFAVVVVSIPDQPSCLIEVVARQGHHKVKFNPCEETGVYFRPGLMLVVF